MDEKGATLKKPILLGIILSLLAIWLVACDREKERLMKEEIENLYYSFQERILRDDTLGAYLLMEPSFRNLHPIERFEKWSTPLFWGDFPRIPDLGEIRITLQGSGGSIEIVESDSSVMDYYSVTLIVTNIKNHWYFTGEERQAID